MITSHKTICRWAIQPDLSCNRAFNNKVRVTLTCQHVHLLGSLHYNQHINLLAHHTPVFLHSWYYNSLCPSMLMNCPTQNHCYLYQLSSTIFDTVVTPSLTSSYRRWPSHFVHSLLTVCNPVTTVCRNNLRSVSQSLW